MRSFPIKYKALLNVGPKNSLVEVEVEGKYWPATPHSLEIEGDPAEVDVERITLLSGEEVSHALNESQFTALLSVGHGVGEDLDYSRKAGNAPADIPHHWEV